jgi:hypothetical protein
MPVCPLFNFSVKYHIASGKGGKERSRKATERGRRGYISNSLKLQQSKDYVPSKDAVGASILENP